MATANKTKVKIGTQTHEGAPASQITPEQQLRRLVMSCLLWEKEFYVDGTDIAEAIGKAVAAVSPEFAADTAVEARTKGNLRHVPLLIAREMARLPLHKQQVGTLLPQIIRRADELTEFLAIYWKDGRSPVSAQVKLGLAAALPRFNEYGLAKYDRDNPVKLRDVLRITHPKPVGADEAALWKKVIDRTLDTPDTWEVALSAGADKKETFERLIKEGMLFDLAFLRNLRNMEKAGVDKDVIFGSMAEREYKQVLPFRFISAARAVPQWEAEIEKAMLRRIKQGSLLEGKTIVLVDISGSMDVAMAGRSEVKRHDAACGIALILREICPDIEVWSFSTETKAIAPRHGFALRDAIVGSQQHGGTDIGGAVAKALKAKPERLVVISDEQSATPVQQTLPGVKAYMVNVASATNGIGYGEWCHVDGFSESIVEYIRAYEGDGLLDIQEEEATIEVRAND